MWLTSGVWQGRQDVTDVLPELITQLKHEADATLKTLSAAANAELQASNHWHVPSLRQAAQAMPRLVSFSSVSCPPGHLSYLFTADIVAFLLSTERAQLMVGELMSCLELLC